MSRNRKRAWSRIAGIVAGLIGFAVLLYLLRRVAQALPWSGLGP